MANQLIGTIVSIGMAQSLATKAGATFTKRDLVLSIQRFDPNTGQPYSDQSNTPQITFMNDRCTDLDNFAVGQLVRVSFDVMGRQYVDRDNNARIINDVRGYKIEPYGAQQSPQPQHTATYLQPVPQQGGYGQAQTPVYYPPQQAAAPAQQVEHVEYLESEVVTQLPQPKKNDGLPF